MKTKSSKILKGIFIFCILSFLFSQSPGANQLVGKWRMQAQNKALDLVLNQNGTGSLSGQNFNYRLQGNQLITTYPNGSSENLNFSLSGNNLTLTMANGATMMFTRMGSSSSNPFPMPNLPKNPFPPARQQPSSSPMNMKFDMYTFKSDPSVKVAYPRGWTVTENQYGVSIVEKQTTDTAGLEIMIISLPPNITSKQALAQMLLNNLRQQMYPDLKIIQQGPHPQAPQVLNISLTYSSKGLPFQAHSWCAVNTQNRIGVFATFYAPNSRFPSFNSQQVLVSCLGPMIGGQ